MTFRKRKHGKLKALNDCDETCACNCAMKCPYPDCGYTCLGGHAYSPNNHWCAGTHQWTAEFVAVSRYERGR